MLNAADFAMLITFFGCASASGCVAASQRVGWFTIFFIAFGLALGYGFGFLVNRLAYRILHASRRQTRPIFAWALMFAYTIIPLLLAFAGIGVAGGLSYCIARGLS